MLLWVFVVGNAANSTCVPGRRIGSFLLFCTCLSSFRLFCPQSRRQIQSRYSEARHAPMMKGEIPTCISVRRKANNVVIGNNSDETSL